MKANETRIEDFLAVNKTRFVIPVYQRNYDWTISQCKQLIDDILEVGTDSELNAHFVGSIVYIHDGIYTSAKVKELTIIDGQQRLTTLTLIYLVLYKFAQKINNSNMESEILETYLINKYSEENDKLKLRATENNEKALRYLLKNENNEEFKEYSRVIDNFDYLRKRISAENYTHVMNGLSKLIFVEISLERDKDNPQRIFESLNSTGLELSQADLIRNYILMGLKREEQLEIYEKYWTIIEEKAKEESINLSRVSDFIRDYLTLMNKKIPNKSNVYGEFKSKFENLSFEEWKVQLELMKRYVYYYNKLLNPENEQDVKISQQLFNLERLEVNVAYPFLIKVYDDYYRNKITKEIFIEVLELV